MENNMKIVQFYTMLALLIVEAFTLGISLVFFTAMLLNIIIVPQLLIFLTFAFIMAMSGLLYYVYRWFTKPV